MEIKLNHWYEFKSGDIGEFIIPIEKDGMYNVFRMSKSQDFKPIYTDKEFNTGYGDNIIREIHNPNK